MKICVISSSALPSPAPDYSGLEMITANLAMEAAKRGHNVTLITTKGSAWEGNWNLEDAGVQKGTLSVLSTIEPSWSGNSERNHYLTYRTFIEKEYGEGQGIVWDNSVTPDAKILVKHFVRGKLRVEYKEIGEFVDNIMHRHRNKVKTLNNTEYLDGGGWYTPTIRKNTRSTWARIRQVSRHFVDDDIVKLTLMGGRTIKLTRGHNVFTWSTVKKDFELVKAEEALGREIIIPAKLPPVNKKGLTELDGLELTDDLLVFLGLWLGDGSYDDTRDKRGYTRRLIHLDCCNDVECQTVIQNVSSNLSHSLHVSRGLTGRIWDKGLMTWMQTHGFTGDVYTKTIPNWMYLLSEKQIGKVLRGLFSADGGKRQDCVTLLTASKSLGDSVSLCLDILGIEHTRRQFIKLSNWSRWQAVHYEINITRYMYDRFSGLVGFLQNDTQGQIDKETTYRQKGSVASRYDIITARGRRFKVKRRRGDMKSLTVKKIEQSHYRGYVYDLAVKETEKFIANGILAKNTWLAYAYLSAKSFPHLKLLHTHHGMLGFRMSPPVSFPRMIGLSKPHAHLISQSLNIPARYCWNGIPLPEWSPEKYTRQNYLLSLNRITDEKGIHDSIDVAVQAKTPIVIAGDDTHVNSQQYVNQIIQSCRRLNGCTYLGLVDNNTRNELLRNCKAVVGCPKPTWMEGFGLYAVEAGSYGKPVLALANGGLTDIIEQGKTGFISAGPYSNPNDLVQYVQRLDDIKPEDCRARVEQEFSVARMTDRYLQMFEGVMNGDPTYFW
jgi:glycosyltransferase involved in cell wall biosynthesis